MNPHGIGKMKNFINIRSSRRFAILASTVAVSVLAACSSDAPTPQEQALAPSGTTTGTQPDSSRGASGSAVAGIRILIRQFTLLTNGTQSVTVIPVDANGVPSLALLAGRPTLSTANSAIATANSANPSVHGVSAGTTKLYATLGDLKDSVDVTVLAKLDTVPPGTPSTPSTPTTPTAPPSIFTLTVYAFGRALPVSAKDTANVVQLPGASVSVYRLSKNPAVPSDSLGVQTLVKTAIADGSGKAVVSDLPSGVYRAIVTATYQGAAMEGQQDFGPPGLSDFAIAVYLSRK